MSRCAVSKAAWNIYFEFAVCKIIKDRTTYKVTDNARMIPLALEANATASYRSTDSNIPQLNAVTEATSIVLYKIQI